MIHRQGLWLTLQKPEKGDIPVMIDWLQEPVFIANLFGNPDTPASQTISNIHRMLNDNAKDLTQNLTFIAHRYDGVPIGLVMLNHINWKNRLAEMNLAIGNIEHRNTMYGGELYLLGLLMAFQELNLNKIYGYVYQSNSSSLRLSSFVGKQEGTLRNHYYGNGNYLDVNIISLFREEFDLFLTNEKETILRRYYEGGLL